MKSSQSLLALVGLMFKSLESNYTGLAKLYLVGVCESIEKHFEPYCPYLRGALKAFEAMSIR
jgi:hypothetical protein